MYIKLINVPDSRTKFDNWEERMNTFSMNGRAQFAHLWKSTNYYLFALYEEKKTKQNVYIVANGVVIIRL